jgi:peroxiredoxin
VLTGLLLGTSAAGWDEPRTADEVISRYIAALDLLKKHALTFPCIVDSSTKGQKLMQTYSISAAPTTYIIDKEGKIMAAWVGFSENDDNIKGALKKLGLE